MLGWAGGKGLRDGSGGGGGEMGGGERAGGNPRCIIRRVPSANPYALPTQPPPLGGSSLPLPLPLPPSCLVAAAAANGRPTYVGRVIGVGSPQSEKIIE